MDATDEQLVADYRSGSSEAFETLYERYVRRLYDFVYYKTHHKETAEDIVSQTFLQAFQNLGTFDSERGVFSAWIHRIARNLTFDHFRAMKSSVPIDDAWDIPSNADVARDADAALKVEKVKAYLQTLSPDQREIILLRLWQDLPFKEIADITGKTEAACKMAYKRGTEKLRDELLIAFLLLFLS